MTFLERRSLCQKPFWYTVFHLNLAKRRLYNYFQPPKEVTTNFPSTLPLKTSSPGGLFQKNVFFPWFFQEKLHTSFLVLTADLGIEPKFPKARGSSSSRSKRKRCRKFTSCLRAPKLARQDGSNKNTSYLPRTPKPWKMKVLATYKPGHLPLKPLKM